MRASGHSSAFCKGFQILELLLRKWEVEKGTSELERTMLSSS